jgi:uncharacterized protein
MMGGMSNAQDSVKARLQADLTAAMKARDEVATSTIRMVRSAITNAEVAGDTAIELTDEQVIAVLRSEAKKRHEAAELYEQAGRAESAAKERAELAVIERYLPAAMSDADLAALVDEAVADATAAAPKARRPWVRSSRPSASAPVTAPTVGGSPRPSRPASAEVVHRSLA